MDGENDDIRSMNENWLTKRRFADKYPRVGSSMLFVAVLCMEHTEAFEQSFACRDDKRVTAVGGNGTNMILSRLSVRQTRAFSIA